MQNFILIIYNQLINQLQLFKLFNNYLYRAKVRVSFVKHMGATTIHYYTLLYYTYIEIILN